MNKKFKITMVILYCMYNSSLELKRYNDLKKQLMREDHLERAALECNRTNNLN